MRERGVRDILDSNKRFGRDCGALNPEQRAGILELLYKLVPNAEERSLIDALTDNEIVTLSVLLMHARTGGELSMTILSFLIGYHLRNEQTPS